MGIGGIITGIWGKVTKNGRFLVVEVGKSSERILVKSTEFLKNQSIATPKLFLDKFGENHG